MRKSFKPPTLMSLCLGLLGKHLEDILDDLSEIAFYLPPNVKMAMTAIARRRKLLNDDVIIALADSSWEVLDVSGSDISDIGLSRVAGICEHVRAVDISRCSNITSLGVSELVDRCPSIEILRLGGSPSSEKTARRCLSFLKPTLNDVEGESWEELDTTEIVRGAQSLRWLVWPTIDIDSREFLSRECPRIILNPGPYANKGLKIPKEALFGAVLDDDAVKDIDPRTWAVAVPRSSRRFALPESEVGTAPSVASPPELSMAERFRLAFVERDARLAPKRAKNARQNQRRAERERVTTDTTAKSIFLASKMAKNLRDW